MSQSFWIDPEYKTFKKYTDKLERDHMKMSEGDLKKAVANWNKGVAKMTQIAIGYDIEFQAPNPSFLTYSEKDSIHWVSFKQLDGFTIGLWDGPERVIDGKPVFSPSYLDMQFVDIEKLTEMHFTDAVIAFLDVMRKFDGVVVPEKKEFF